MRDIARVNLRSLRFGCVALIIPLNLIAVGPAFADDAPPPAAGSDPARLASQTRETEAEAETSSRVIKLQHACPSDVARRLAPLVRARITLVPDDKDGSLVVQGREAQVEQLVQLLTLLNAPIVAETSTEVVRLKHLTDERFLSRALSLILGDSSDFVVHGASRMCIIRGDEESRARARRILAELDQPPHMQAEPRPIRLRLIWLASDLTSEAPPPPADLNAVLGELEGIGVSDLRLVMQAVIEATRDESFRLSSPTVVDDECYVNTQGIVTHSPTGRARAEIGVHVSRSPAAQMPRPQRSPPPQDTLYSFSSTVALPGDEPVILSVGPMEERISVFLIQLMPSR